MQFNKTVHLIKSSHSHHWSSGHWMWRCHLVKSGPMLIPNNIFLMLCVLFSSFLMQRNIHIFNATLPFWYFEEWNKFALKTNPILITNDTYRISTPADDYKDIRMIMQSYLLMFSAALPFWNFYFAFSIVINWCRNCIDIACY